jgi:hypothetical protein
LKRDIQEKDVIAGEVERLNILVAKMVRERV